MKLELHGTTIMTEGTERIAEVEYNLVGIAERMVTCFNVCEGISTADLKTCIAAPRPLFALSDIAYIADGEEEENE